MDRGLSKLCRLPIFNDRFAAMLILLGITSVEFVTAFSAKTGVQFSHAVMNLAPAMTQELDDAKSKQVLEQVANSGDLLELFWALVTAAKDTFLAESAVSFGFGQANRPALNAADSSSSSAKKLRTALGRSTVLSANYNVKVQPQAALTPLMEQELILKHKWILRLEGIASAAGSAALYNSPAVDDVLTDEERTKLKRLVLAVGAFRTISFHVRHWERFATWSRAEGLNPYPPSLDLCIKYAMFLDAQECGPTVIPSARAAIAWVCSRIQMQAPALEGPEIKAIEMKVVELRAQEVKEAVPLPLDLVRELELHFHRSSATAPKKAVFIGWILCLLYASLRFNDGVHVKPSSLELKDNILYGLCWQTKVERKRRGTKFAIAAVGLIGPEELDDDGFGFKPWLLVFLELFEIHAAGDRDFWMFEMSDSENFTPNTPISYTRGLRFLKLVLAESVLRSNFAIPRKVVLSKILEQVTWHSLRVTLLDAAVHAGVDALPISMQANHATTDLVVKYTRERRQVPLQMVGKLLSDLRHNWHPRSEALVPIQDEFSEDEPDELLPQFYVKKGVAHSRLIVHPKFHVTSKDDLTKLACNMLQISECEPIGAALPDISVLCGRCKASRSDIWP